MPFYTFLANANDIIATLSKLRHVLFLAVLAMAFVMGFFKGFRRVSWSGLIWFTASVLFIAISKIALPAPALGITEAITALVVAVACVIAVMGVYACLAGLVRPKIRWVKDDVNGDTSLAEYGLEFEPEYADYDGEDDWKPYGKRLQKTGFLPPSFFARLLGGITGMVNAAMMVFSITALLIFGLEIAGIHSETLNSILTHESMKPLIDFTNSYILDVIVIGAIFLLAKRGINKGFAHSCTSTGLWIVGLGLCGVCMWLPFSVFAKAESGVFLHFAEFVNRCLVAGVSISAPFGAILGKLLAGFILVAIAIAVLALLHFGMKKLCKVIESNQTMKVMDECFSALVYAVIGAVICIAVFAALACLEYFGIFQISGVFGENAVLSQTLFDTVLQEVKTLLATKLG